MNARNTITLGELAGSLDVLAQKHSDEAKNFRALDLPELALRSAGRAFTLRAAVTELVLMAQQEEGN